MKSKGGTKKPKKTPKRVLAKREERRLLKEWREAALQRANNQCEWCGSQIKGLNCHHILTRKIMELRTDPANSIILCAKDHKFGKLSAHNNPIRMSEWLKRNRPNDWEFLKGWTDNALCCK